MRLAAGALEQCGEGLEPLLAPRTSHRAERGGEGAEQRGTRSIGEDGGRLVAGVVAAAVAVRMLERTRRRGEEHCRHLMHKARRFVQLHATPRAAEPGAVAVNKDLDAVL